jgi:hypothetical protein
MIPALKARCSTAQGEGRRAAETLGVVNEKEISPERAMQKTCSAPSGLAPCGCLPRVPVPAVAGAFTLGFAAPSLRDSVGTLGIGFAFGAGEK